MSNLEEEVSNIKTNIDHLIKIINEKCKFGNDDYNYYDYPTLQEYIKNHDVKLQEIIQNLKKNENSSEIKKIVDEIIVKIDFLKKIIDECEEKNKKNNQKEDETKLDLSSPINSIFTVQGVLDEKIKEQKLLESSAIKEQQPRKRFEDEDKKKSIVYLKKRNINVQKKIIIESNKLKHIKINLNENQQNIINTFYKSNKSDTIDHTDKNSNHYINNIQIDTIINFIYEERIKYYTIDRKIIVFKPL
jgi:hypothetical protein